MLSLPQYENILIQDMPVWLRSLECEDGIVKSKPIQHLLQDYQFIIQSKYIYSDKSTDRPLEKFLEESIHLSSLTKTEKVTMDA